MDSISEFIVRPLHIAFVSEDDSSYSGSWSGIPFSMSSALVATGAIVTRHTPVRTPPPICLRSFQRLIGNRFSQWTNRYSLPSLKSLGRSTSSSVNGEPHIDFVLSVHPDPIAYAHISQPCGFIGDCNFELLAKTYPRFRSLNQVSLNDGSHMYKAGLKRSTFCALASDWAAADTRHRYPEFASKVHVLPFGANLTSGWGALHVDHHIANKSFQPLRLLSVGVDWKRKGMTDTVGVLLKLKEMGADVVLDIVGCVPPKGFQIPPGVTIHGQMRQSVAGEVSHLRSLFERANIFILGSRAECFGIVFGEAASFGVPSFGVSSCGIPSAVRDGVTGRLFPERGWQDAVAKEIMVWLKNPLLYRSLAKGAWIDAVGRLNWDVIAAQLINLIRENLNKNP